MRRTEVPGLRPGEWKRIASTTAIALSVAGLFFIGYQAVVSLGRILTLLAIALFFTVVLTPAVDFLQHRVSMGLLPRADSGQTFAAGAGQEAWSQQARR